DLLALGAPGGAADQLGGARQHVVDHGWLVGADRRRDREPVADDRPLARRQGVAQPAAQLGEPGYATFVDDLEARTEIGEDARRWEVRARERGQGLGERGAIAPRGENRSENRIESRAFHGSSIGTFVPGEGTVVAFAEERSGLLPGGGGAS